MDCNHQINNVRVRYDVEVDHSRRPALRKIMEKDDAAAKALVLCICGVVSQDQVANPCAVVWLTDGWYSVKAQLDEPLSALLRKGRLAAGGKLIIHGAQLVGSQEACAPLEAPQSLMLKVHARQNFFVGVFFFFFVPGVRDDCSICYPLHK